MTDRNAKPFTLFIFGLIFAIMIISQVVVKVKYENLLRHELEDFTNAYISYTENLDTKISGYLKTFSAFESLPTFTYQKMIDAAATNLNEVEAIYLFFEDGTRICTCTQDEITESEEIIKQILDNTNSSSELIRYYTDDGNVYYSKNLYHRYKKKAVIIIKISSENLIDMLEEVYKNFAWLNITIKDRRGNTIFQSNERTERAVTSKVEELFEKSDKGINEERADILYQTKTSKKTTNKDMIGKYKPDILLNKIEKEILRRNNMIASTTLGENLQLTFTASSSLQEVDPNYYSRIILMLFLLVVVLIIHLVIGFIIPDKAMATEFTVCLVVLGIIFFTHMTLELGFLNNLYENELEYYAKLTSSTMEYDYTAATSLSGVAAELATLQDDFMPAPGYNTFILNWLFKQTVAENDVLEGVGVFENGELKYHYPEGIDFSKYAQEIKQAGRAETQRVLFDKANEKMLVFTKIKSKINPDAVLLCEYSVASATGLQKNEKFEIFGFRDAYGESKILNLKTNEVVDSFIKKVPFDEKTKYVTGIKYLNHNLYGYVMIPNQANNINVIRYELENLYFDLAIYFVVVMILIILIALFARKVFGGYKVRQKIDKEDTVYEKLIEKIDKDIADYGDDTLD